MNRWKHIGPMFVAVAFATTPAIAQEMNRPKALSITATVVTETETHTSGQPDNDPAALYPGAEVRYQLVFTNVVGVPVQNIEFTDRIPVGLVYVIGSTASDGDDVVIEYSIDGGSTYNETPIVEVTVDGERVLQPAPPDMYTHIRWHVKDVIQPRAHVTAEFRAQLPNSTQPTNSGSSRTGRDG